MIVIQKLWCHVWYHDSMKSYMISYSARFQMLGFEGGWAASAASAFTNGDFTAFTENWAWSSWHHDGPESIKYPAVVCQVDDWLTRIEWFCPFHFRNQYYSLAVPHCDIRASPSQLADRDRFVRRIFVGPGPGHPHSTRQTKLLRRFGGFRFRDDQCGWWLIDSDSEHWLVLPISLAFQKST